MITHWPFTGSAAGLVADAGRCILVDGVTNTVTTSDGASSFFAASSHGVLAFSANSYGTVSALPADPTCPVGSTRVMRVSFPSQSCSPGDKYKGNTPATAALAGVVRPYGGSIAIVQSLRSQTSYVRLLYAVKVPTGFSWRLGGKLPGIASVSTSASGGRQKTAGLSSFTARLMWKQDGKIETYFYNNGTRKAGAVYGTNFNNLPDVFLQIGWNVIEIELMLNDPGQVNGSCRASLNGVDFINRSDMDWVDSTQLKIGGAWMNSFFGGSTFVDGDDTWETLVDSYLDFSDLLCFAT